MKKLVHPDGSIRELLQALRRRQRAVNALEYMVKGFLGGACVAALVGLLRWIIGPAPTGLSSLYVLLLIPTGAALGAAVGLLRRIDELHVARALDAVAKGEDRFASAVQLGGHPRSARVRLVTQDALSAVTQVSVPSALPVRVARELKLLPLPAIMLAALLWLGSGPRSAATLPAPEIAAEQWSDLSEEFRKELNELPQPETPEEKDFARAFEKLASLLEKQPRTKEVFEEIAKLRAKMESRRQSLPGRSLSMQKAARAVQASSALTPFADELKRGNYPKAAESLKSLAKGLRNGTQNLSAEQFEAAAADFDRLSKELETHDELGHACKQCASAASSMNNRKLSDAMNELSKQLQKNAENLRQSDKLCRSCNMLDRLQRRMNQCKSCSACKDGKCGQCGSCQGNNFVQRSNKKGGSKAGWGSADNWQSGRLTPAGEQRTPDLAETREQAGRQTTFSVVQPDEQADSALRHKEMYAEFVQKAEADLSLESVPVAYREFLRRYFESIQPPDQADGGDSEE